uniref:Homocysteine-responsive endoplasmic reticulum-resident ubiquitin-like domain member 2 protein n=1 Tax=Petromyzon marinus TaxID=7757 RepID=A0AAJ7TGI8_PETMA|nr:homocysteine-responsive endoplasmic reticulum-resident ubiquitin-like domain member 2 protein [Petromyzon marinus]XP_032816448.1 homocysteine-responsive endoplasmic reticulum-resident ubiquitin-like domain member 2 protein [Petromyzon marinus]XP_032816449.1 homocysteine-responsive endoplasmic reticulum-resident ubiquitin-like domain member 2 protein [Petromyzon marinus]XP_032816450.1 homocysteine-responsive endoplasmic reticulum-resident ubiquitin-like domain member 2 protein [Petromyzon mari
MEMSAGSLVTLVIKAPNQKYDDQTLECGLDWTVHRLKSHISEVYPGHPGIKDQRLIYSGKLLLDNLMLKDVLRKYDEFHTVHLVCPSSSPPASPRPSNQPGFAQLSETIRSGAASAYVPTRPNVTTMPSSQGVGADGLRQRHVVMPSAYPPPVYGVRDMGQPAVPVLPAYPTYSPHYIMWLQQIYAQHYYTHYQAAVSAAAGTALNPGVMPAVGGATPGLPNPLGTGSLPNPLGAAAAAGGGGGAGGVGRGGGGGGVDGAPVPANRDIGVAAVAARNEGARPANQNAVLMNAQGGAGPEEEEEMNRDWLDWLFTATRTAVLLGIFYFYSSLGRFLMVSGALLLLYLYQTGVFPFQRGPGQAPDQLGGDGEEDLAQELQEMERRMDEGMDLGDTESSDDDSALEADEPSFTTSAWTFVTTFFTSLVPEGAAAMPN